MDLVYDLVVVLHLLGMAMIVGGWLAQVRSQQPQVTPVILYGALAQVITGVVLVGMASADLIDRDPNNTKVAVKLVIAMVVAGLAVVGNVRRTEFKPALVHLLGLLAVANVFVAALW